MELVYLWVDDYKNIQKQGFNFSPRFTCSYDKDTQELTIDENKEHVEDFFGKNINVTAIVGENGSGKSSVLHAINREKVLFKAHNQLHTKSFDIKENTLPLKKSYIEEETYETIYLDYDFLKINPINDYFDYWNGNIYDKNLYTKIENGSAIGTDFNIFKFRENFFNLIVEHNNSFKSNIFSYNPDKIFLIDNIPEIKVQNEQHKQINHFIKEIQEKKLSKEKFLVFLYAKVNYPGVLTRDDKNDLEKSFTKDKETVIKYVDKFELGDIELYYAFFTALEAFEKMTSLSIKTFANIYKEHQKAFLKLIEIGYLQIDFQDYKEREYFGLSQGERKFFTESLMIFDAIKKSKLDDILIVLDEPDLTLHPEWQKRYVNELIKLLSNFGNKKFHVIITSHSPFILSDLPKENVIFLKNGKQVDVDIDTFGANIHTLLSHGFFMQDGLMGEFAKEKINEAIKLLNQKTLNEKEIGYCENIISIIGEPILKRQLQKMLDSKRLSEVEQIKKQIKELQEELAKKEDKKDD